VQSVVSTVMYAYRIRQRDFWDFAMALRAAYHRESWLRKLFIRELVKVLAKEATPEESYETVKHLLSSQALKDATVRLQVFPINQEYLLFRVLENGYFFLNQHEDWPVVRPCFYDDRSDVSPRERRNLKFADRMDEMIREGRYFIFQVISEHDIQRWAWDAINDVLASDPILTPSAD